MRKSGAVTCGLMAAVLAAVVPAAPAVAATAGLAATVGAVLPIGSTETLPTAGIRLTAPADGRMWGFDYVGGVTGVVFTPSAGPAGATVSAPPGGQLCVFHLVIADAQVPFLQTQTAAGFPLPTATITAGTVTIPIADADPDDTGVFQATIAVAVPAGAPVSVALRAEGVTQSFDLRSGRRIGSSPAALYRSTSAEPYLRTVPGAAGALTQTGPPGRFDAAYTDAVSIGAAYLSWFPPQPATALPPAGDGWLIVYPHGGPPAAVSDGEEYETFGLPATAVTLVAAGGARIAGYVTGQSAGDFNTDLFGGGAYYFPVPADFTAGTIDIHPTGPLGVDYTDLGGQSVTGHADLTVTGTVQIPVAFRAAVKTASPPLSAGTVTGGDHHSTIPVWLLAVLAVVVAAAIGVVLRVRRHPGLPARPVTRPSTLTIGSAGRLSPAGVLSLAPAIEATARAVRVGELGPARHHEAADPPSADQSSGDQNEDEGEAAVAAEAGRSGPVLVVRLLGPLQVEGLTARLRRKPAQRLLICLAVWSERALSGDQLRNALATSDEREPSADSLRTYASALRAVLPAGILPAAGLSGGYQLTGDIDIDWAVFQTLTDRAALLPSGRERLTLIETALRLVRGVPLAGETWAGIDQTARHLEATIEQTAADGAAVALDLGQARTAETVLACGLRAVPASLQLWEARLVAAGAGSGIGLERVWQLAQGALGGDAGLLEPVYERLRAGLI